MPLEIIEDLARENGLTVDEAGFNEAFKVQRERSRQDYFSGKVEEQVTQAILEGKTSFVGYDLESSTKATIQAIIVDGKRSESIKAGDAGEVVLDSTPFYAESGGQVGDTGSLAKDGSRAKVTDTVYRGTLLTHVVQMETGVLHEGDEVEASR